MKRTSAINLSQSLAIKDLKSKHLSGSSIVALLSVKRPLDTYLNTMAQDEKESSSGFEFDDAGNVRPEYRKKLREQIEAIQKRDFELSADKLNFMAADDFKKWTEDIDTGPMLVLADFILKE